METITPSQFLKTSKEIPIIDVRSPAEYIKGHITGAHNIPVFTDAERAEVGTLYVQKSREYAIDKGLEIVGPKMKALAREGKTLAKDDQLLVHCWRGGMRSEKMAWLFELVGINCKVLEGGYKAYRQHMLEQMGQIKNLIVIHGSTGTGKTEVLKALISLQEQVVDLEGLANHRGSAFGGMGLSEQPSSGQFQNNVFHEVLKMSPDKRIWIEAESLTIGKVYLPEPLWEVMNVSPGFEIEAERLTRIDRILNEYGHFSTELLEANLLKITKRFGNDRTKFTLEKIRENKLAEAVDDLLMYYDKAYNHGKDRYAGNNNIVVIDFADASPHEIADELVKQANIRSL